MSSEEELRTLKYITVKGVRFGINYSIENVLEAMNYRPKSNDIFIVSYPKCGTTWLQQIVYLILHNGQPAENGIDFFQAAPFIEKEGKIAVENMQLPGVIKTHLSYNLINFSPVAKYIYITRNPKDCCQSFFHHMSTFAPYKYTEARFDEYFEHFLNGEAHFGDYFDNLLSWYAHRNEPNVLFLTYEEMKADGMSSILKIASFLGEKVHKSLAEDNRVVENILKYSGLNYMKSTVNRFFVEYTNHSLELVRKGKIGSWREVLSDEQNRRFNEKIEAKLGGTSILAMWKKQGCL